MNLSAKEKNYLANLQKGYLGEKTFDELLSSLPNNLKLLNDLQLETNHTTFQIDCLGIHSQTLYLFKIKNYEGDYYIENETWYSISKNEISNPIQQLKRSESLLQRFIKNNGFHYSVESYLIFINPEFHLYNAPRNPHIIFPNQLNRFLHKLNTLDATKVKDHSKLVDKLISSQIQTPVYKTVRPFTFNDLRKGITCIKCKCFINNFIRKYLKCNYCGHKEEADFAVLRTIDEFITLFPDMKINTKIIQEWCKIIPYQTIHRIMSKHFKRIGYGKSTFYIKY